MEKKNKTWLILPMICYNIYENGNRSIEIGWFTILFTINF